MASVYADRETVFAGLMDDRQAWEQASKGRRRLAIAADAELRRRHPRQKFPPLRSAEPEPPTEAQRGELVFTPGAAVPQAGSWIQELATKRATFAQRFSEQRSSMKEDPSFAHAAHEAQSRRELDQPLLQPPKPEIRPSARILERVAQRQADLEAGA